MRRVGGGAEDDGAVAVAEWCEVPGAEPGLGPEAGLVEESFEFAGGDCDAEGEAGEGASVGGFVDVGEPGDGCCGVGGVGGLGGAARLGEFLSGEFGHEAEAGVFAGPLKAEGLGAELEVFGAGGGDVEGELSVGCEEAGGGAECGELVGAGEEVLEGAEGADDEVELSLARGDGLGEFADVGVDDLDPGCAHAVAALLEHDRGCVNGGDVVSVLREGDCDAASACAELEDAGGGAA